MRFIWNLIKVIKVNIKGVSKDYNDAVIFNKQGFLRKLMTSNRGISKDKSCIFSFTSIAGKSLKCVLHISLVAASCLRTLCL